MTPLTRAEKWKPRTVSAWWLLVVYAYVKGFTKGLLQRFEMLSHLQYERLAADFIGAVLGILAFIIVYFLAEKALRQFGIELNFGGQESMSEDSRILWRRRRHKGMVHFVLFFCVLRWAFPFGLIPSPLFFLLGNFLSAASGMGADFSLLGFFHTLIYGSVYSVFIGIAFGVVAWFTQEEAYAKPSEDKPEPNLLNFVSA